MYYRQTSVGNHCLKCGWSTWLDKAGKPLWEFSSTGRRTPEVVWTCEIREVCSCVRWHRPSARSAIDFVTRFGTNSWDCESKLFLKKASANILRFLALHVYLLLLILELISYTFPMFHTSASQHIASQKPYRSYPCHLCPFTLIRLAAATHCLNTRMTSPIRQVIKIFGQDSVRQFGILYRNTVAETWFPSEMFVHDYGQLLLRQ